MAGDTRPTGIFLGGDHNHSSGQITSVFEVPEDGSWVTAWSGAVFCG
jgi:hypothetical protein